MLRVFVGFQQRAVFVIPRYRVRLDDENSVYNDVIQNKIGNDKRIACQILHIDPQNVDPVSLSGRRGDRYGFTGQGRSLVDRQLTFSGDIRSDLIDPYKHSLTAVAQNDRALCIVRRERFDGGVRLRQPARDHLRGRAAERDAHADPRVAHEAGVNIQLRFIGDEQIVVRAAVVLVAGDVRGVVQFDLTAVCVNAAAFFGGIGGHGRAAQVQIDAVPVSVTDTAAVLGRGVAADGTAGDVQIAGVIDAAAVCRGVAADDTAVQLGIARRDTAAVSARGIIFDPAAVDLKRIRGTAGVEDAAAFFGCRIAADRAAVDRDALGGPDAAAEVGAVSGDAAAFDRDPAVVADTAAGVRGVAAGDRAGAAQAAVGDRQAASVGNDVAVGDCFAAGETSVYGMAVQVKGQRFAFGDQKRGVIRFGGIISVKLDHGAVRPEAEHILKRFPVSVAPLGNRRRVGG